MRGRAISRRQILAGVGAGAVLNQILQGQSAGERVFRYVFNQESHGWIPGLSDYSLEATDLRFTAELRPFPPNFRTDFRAYYLQSRNTPDDLFMFLKKELSTEDGIEPDRTYGISIHVGFLSNAPSGAGPGIGGSPGASVFLKAGVSLLEPVAILDADRSYVGLSVDKGSQSQGGRDLQVVSTIENGYPQVPDQPYAYLERVHHFPNPVRTDRRGALWITVGTESGFEGLTGIYFYEIIVTLRSL